MKTLTAVAALLLAMPAAAALEVAATTPNMGMLARTVGAEHVEVRLLAPGDRDVHFLEARPSMIVALRRAELLVAVGAELEGGWLPVAIQRANNPRVQPGRPGYFEAAAAVELLEAGGPADRGLGDVHPMGNPHVYFDPLRMAAAGLALAERMAALDGANAAAFRANAEAFAARLATAVDGWRARARGTPGVVLFHKDANYLMDRLGVSVHGYVEPVPGLPPTARHLQQLVAELEDRRGVILHMRYEPAQGPRRLGRQLGWPVLAMDSNVPDEGTADDYVALIERWVASLEEV
jgi:zinc/manganese transport system substrate-binding protein